jgi:hypothetical protein
MLKIAPSVCSCLKCKAMCKTSPCFGTPIDIQQLITAGYKDRLIATAWVDVEWDGLWPVIAPTQTGNGCIFLTNENLCELHNLNLKPTEGRLAHHAFPYGDKLRRSVSFTWINQHGFNVFSQFDPGPELITRFTELRKAYSR